MNPLSLVLIAMVVLERFDQAEEALSFIEKVGRFLYLKGSVQQCLVPT